MCERVGKVARGTECVCVIGGRQKAAQVCLRPELIIAACRCVCVCVVDDRRAEEISGCIH